MAEAGLLGLYVHIPFCSGRCSYCDFTSSAGREALVPRYLGALTAEAKLCRLPRSPETLYIGGGTPSQLRVEQIEELFAGLRQAFPDSRFGEVTFEANPESVDAEKLGVLRRAGVTRLSLGWQALDDQLLKSMGRRHAVADCLRAYRLAREARFDSVSVDIICGLPGQTRSKFLSGLGRVLELAPDHLSLYGLEIHEGTLLSRQGFVPDEDLSRDMLEDAIDCITAAGLAHYEISNFARPGHESKHNLNYWDGGEYLGLGCAAASHLGGLRTCNTSDLDEYFRLVEAGVWPWAESERIEGKDKLGERAFLGLRRIAGLELDPELESFFAREWLDLERRGLIVRHGRRVRLTREGLFLANEAFSKFVSPFEVPI